VHPDAYNKINGLLTYSQGDDADGVRITARAYHGKWNSSDQIPLPPCPRWFPRTLNPSDGGHSQRYSLQGEGYRQNANSESKISAYVFYYDLDLFSDFTYYLVDYNKGDQFEQQDRRWVGGWTHTTRFSANGLAARWEIPSACSCATIGSTTAFTGRKIACVQPKPITPPPASLSTTPSATPTHPRLVSVWMVVFLPLFPPPAHFASDHGAG